MRITRLIRPGTQISGLSPGCQLHRQACKERLGERLCLGAGQGRAGQRQRTVPAGIDVEAQPRTAIPVRQQADHRAAGGEATGAVLRLAGQPAAVRRVAIADGDPACQPDLTGADAGTYRRVEPLVVAPGEPVATGDAVLQDSGIGEGRPDLFPRCVEVAFRGQLHRLWFLAAGEAAVAIVRAAATSPQGEECCPAAARAPLAAALGATAAASPSLLNRAAGTLISPQRQGRGLCGSRQPSARFRPLLPRDRARPSATSFDRRSRSFRPEFLECANRAGRLHQQCRNWREPQWSCVDADNW